MKDTKVDSVASTSVFQVKNASPQPIVLHALTAVLTRSVELNTDDVEAAAVNFSPAITCEPTVSSSLKLKTVPKAATITSSVIVQLALVITVAGIVVSPTSKSKLVSKKAPGVTETMISVTEPLNAV